MIDLSRRSTEVEYMDGEDVTPDEFAACMKDLALVNTVTLARRPTLAFIDRALRATAPDRVLTVMDVGFGEGDMLRAIGRLARRRGRAIRLVGVDLNPRSEVVAKAVTPPDMPIAYSTGDYADWPPDDAIDLVISSIVTHHMTQDEILRFLQWMEARAQLGWLINDLHRHLFPYYGFALLATVMRWHPFVRHDGPVSIARAFTRHDWDRLLALAGVSGDAVVQWWFPFRYCVERVRW
ncbi:MAG: methyltransferase domain-containing protein [Sphingomonas sp.]